MVLNGRGRPRRSGQTSAIHRGHMTAMVPLQADKGPPAAPPTRPATFRRAWPRTGTGRRGHHRHPVTRDPARKSVGRELADRLGLRVLRDGLRQRSRVAPVRRDPTGPQAAPVGHAAALPRRPDLRRLGWVCTVVALRHLPVVAMQAVLGGTIALTARAGPSPATPARRVGDIVEPRVDRGAPTVGSVPAPTTAATATATAGAAAATTTGGPVPTTGQGASGRRGRGGGRLSARPAGADDRAGRRPGAGGGAAAAPATNGTVVQ